MIKKSIAGYWEDYIENITMPDGQVIQQKNRKWIEQQDIDMTSSEEAEIRAHWAIGDSLSKVPLKASMEDEHNWLIEHGPEYVKAKREDWEKEYSIWKKRHDPLVEAHKLASDAYQKSMETK